VAGLESELDEILATPVFMRGENRPLRELTVADVRDRAAELRSTVGWGPTARVAPVARAWAELAAAMARESAPTVSGVSRETLREIGSRLWVKL
jgi:hypothetical protein